MENRRAKSPSKFERKLYGALLVLLMGLFSLVYYSYTSLVSVNSERAHLTEVYAQTLTLASDLRFQQAQEDTFALSLILSGEPKLHDQMKKAREDFLGLTRRLEAIDPSPSALSQLRRIRELKDRLVSETEAHLLQRAKGGSRTEADRLLKKSEPNPGVELNAALAGLFQYELSRFTNAREEINVSTARQIRGFDLISILIGGGFVLTALLLVGLARRKQAQDLDRERLYEAARQTAEARKEALETVSHDLKSPLSAVELNLELLQRQNQATGKNATSGRSVAVAFHAVNTMKDLIQSLLDQAKMEAGTFELDLRSSRLSELIEDVRNILAPLAEQKRIQIEIVDSGEISPICVDPRRISQAISNIVGNAIKFTPDGGNVSIRAVLVDRGVRLSISDTGPGIPRDQAERIFERFWQPNATRRQGTGLGLAIAKGVVEAHQGKIWVESEPGEGATFHLFIPTLAFENRCMKSSAA